MPVKQTRSQSKFCARPQSASHFFLVTLKTSTSHFKGRLLSTRRLEEIEEMVSLRGISVHGVSQIEARRLPEYSTAQAVDSNGPVAACYIPTIPGAQIWFEYSIDGPHPPNAMYLFKLFIDGQHVTTWVRLSYSHPASVC